MMGVSHGTSPANTLVTLVTLVTLATIFTLSYSYIFQSFDRVYGILCYFESALIASLATIRFTWSVG